MTRGESVGNVRRSFALDRYEQCSLQRLRKQPSSTWLGARPSRFVMVSRSVGGSRDMNYVSLLYLGKDNIHINLCSFKASRNFIVAFSISLALSRSTQAITSF